MVSSNSFSLLLIAPDDALESKPLSSTMYPFKAAGAGVFRISSSAAETGDVEKRVAAAPRPTMADASLQGKQRERRGEVSAGRGEGV